MKMKMKVVMRLPLLLGNEHLLPINIIIFQIVDGIVNIAGNGNVGDLYNSLFYMLIFFLIDNSKNFGDSSTTTLWRHFNNNHSKKYGGVITGPMDKFCNSNNNLPEEVIGFF